MRKKINIKWKKLNKILIILNFNWKYQYEFMIKKKFLALTTKEGAKISNIYYSKHLYSLALGVWILFSIKRNQNLALEKWPNLNLGEENIRWAYDSMLC